MDCRRSKSQVTRKSRSPAKKVPSKIYPNPFLNFLSDFRKSNKQKLSCVEVSKRGAQLWRGMSAREKSPYRHISKQAPKYKYRRSRSRRKRRSRRSRRRGRRSRGRRSRRRRRGRSRSSSFTDTDASVERKHAHDKRSDKIKREQKHEKNDETKQNRTDRDNKDQKGGYSKSSEKGENRTEDDDDDMRYKSADYDDIRRDYI